jgi:hypothetical protein
MPSPPGVDRSFRCGDRGMGLVWVVWFDQLCLVGVIPKRTFTSVYAKIEVFRSES